MTSEDTDARLRILEMVESGTISPEEGAKLLEALSVEQEDPLTSASPPEPAEVLGAVEQEGASSETFKPASIPPGAEKWRFWWQIPLWIGAGITIVGGLLMYLALQNQGVGFWFFCAWLPFLLGLIAIAIGWASRSARWLHVRIHATNHGGPRRIAISFPLPIRLSAWFLRNFGHFIPQLNQTGLDELILALGENATPETPLYVNVDEGEDGDRVEVFIG